MKNSRKPKGAWSITKLSNGKLKVTLTLGVGAYGKQEKITKLWWYKELPVNYRCIYDNVGAYECLSVNLMYNKY